MRGSCHARLLSLACLLVERAASANICVKPAVPFSGDLSANYTNEVDAIREATIFQLGYAPTVPISDRSAGPYCNVTRAGTDVSMQIRFYKVVKVNQATGLMEVKVWFRLSWVDRRLAWDPADYGGVSYYSIPTASPEYAKMWLPDITMLVQASPRAA